MPKRKLGDPAPDIMYIDQGEMKMSDGSNLQKYLGDWQSKNDLENGTKVCVVTKESLEMIEGRLKFLLAFTFC